MHKEGEGEREKGEFIGSFLVRTEMSCPQIQGQISTQANSHHIFRKEIFVLVSIVSIRQKYFFFKEVVGIYLSGDQAMSRLHIYIFFFFKSIYD